MNLPLLGPNIVLVLVVVLVLGWTDFDDENEDENEDDPGQATRQVPGPNARPKWSGGFP